MRIFKYNNYSVSYRFRNSENRTLIFLHGLGDNKKTFDPVFKSDLLKDFNILTADMIGFGESEKPLDFDYCLKKQSDMIFDLIEYLNLNNIYIVAHSFGGTAAVLLAEKLKSLLKAFVNCEGMLTEEDITWSKTIYNQKINEFKEKGFKDFKERIKKASIKYPSNKVYYQQLQKTIPEAMYLSVKSMIDFINKEDLIKKFVDLECRKYYIFGENSHKRENKTEVLLKEYNIPVYYVPESGHFMVIDNAEEFYKKIKMIIDES